MKKILFLFALLLPLCVSAEQALVVHLRDGRTSLFALGETPRMAASSGEVTVTGGLRTLTYALDQVERFSLEDVDLTSVDAAESPCITYRLTDGGLAADGLVPGSPVRVYDTGGRLLQSATADGNGHVSLPLGHGLHIVKTKSETFKVMKR